MIITDEIKGQVREALKSRRENFTGSDAKYAVSLGMNNAQYSRIKNGDIDRVLADANWLRLARMLDIQQGGLKEWKTVQTPFFIHVTTQLEHCQKHSISRMLCDLAGIGKSYAAKHYAKTHKDVVYVDCSQVKSKQKFIRYIAGEFGVGNTGKYADVYADLIYYLRALPNPLIITDEVGDLEYPAFLELKALWNATEHFCGWYAMGADGLKHKIELGINHAKVGYTEIFSRFGGCFQRQSPEDEKEAYKYKSTHAAMIIKANAPDANVLKLITDYGCNLRSIADAITIKKAV